MLDMADDIAKNPWFILWREHCSRYFSLEASDRILETELGLIHKSKEKGAALFSAQTYASLVIDAVARRIGGHHPLLTDHPTLFDGYKYRHPQNYEVLVERFYSNLCGFPSQTEPEEISTYLGDFFQDVFPPSLRHLLGEYYTPAWIIDDAIQMLDISRVPDSIVMFDPAAGSGGFVVRLLKRLSESKSFVKISLVLSDISPIANKFSALNISCLTRHLSLTTRSSINVAIFLADAVCDGGGTGGDLFKQINSSTICVLGRPFTQKPSKESIDAAVKAYSFCSELESSQFKCTLHSIVDSGFVLQEGVNADIICGNPPWISWDGILPAYRSALAQQWAGSSLITNAGWRAKVAAGKNDLSTLFVYRAAERHAAPGAVMLFALPISVFQARHSSAGFRKFRAGSRRYAVTAIIDLSKTTVFKDALNRASVAAFRVDVAPEYPVPYATLRRMTDAGREYDWAQARPLDSASAESPIVLSGNSKDEEQLFARVSKSHYRARGGINTGGANAILWVDCLSRADGLARVANRGKSRGISMRTVEAEIEAACVVPLLVGKDIRRWHAKPSRNILLLYDPKNPKKALPEEEVKQRFPLSYAYLQNFKRELIGRKEYQRWGGDGPFYEIYRIGPYTFSKSKVVWQHTGFRGRMRVCVVTQDEDNVVVPDQKVILIACDNSDEAHFVCAYLASGLVEKIINKYIGLDASAHILDYVGLRQFNNSDAVHMQLSALSKEAHRLVESGQDCSEIEQAIDEAVEKLFVDL